AHERGARRDGALPDADAGDVEAIRWLGPGPGAPARGGRHDSGVGGGRQPGLHRRRVRSAEGEGSMSVPAVKPIEDSEFAARSELDGVRLRLHLWGNADMRAKDPLDRFLTAVDDRAVANATEEVVVDLRELVFM